MDHKFKLKKIITQFAICKLNPGEPVPAWAVKGETWSITKTSSELSILCAKSDMPEDIHTERIWRALQVEGQFSFDVVGVLASISKCLSDAGISILAVSTFDTDLIFVFEENFDIACRVLIQAGHIIND
jgi:hypothetical protein